MALLTTLHSDETEEALPVLKFMFSKKATKNEEIFTVNLTVTINCQIEGEDFVNFCGLLRKRELYVILKFLRCAWCA